MMPEEQLVAYFAGDLDETAAAAVEEHFFSCADCAREAERIAVLAVSIREMIPLIIGREQIDALRARGLTIIENIVPHGAPPKPIGFPPGVDLILHVLSGMDLSGVDALEVTILDDVGGTSFAKIAGAPFDRSRGEVIIACQKHFAAYPPNVRFEIRDQSGGELGRFVVPHVYV